MEKLRSRQKQFLQTLLHSKSEADDRTEVYREGVWERFFQSLEEDFPLVSLHLGDHARSVFEEYMHQHPSRSPTLVGMGRSLDHFLSQQTHLAPYLAELARLEWLRTESRFAFAPPSTGLNQISTADEGMWEGACLIPNPAFRFFKSRFDFLPVFGSDPDSLVVPAEIESRGAFYVKDGVEQVVWFSPEQFEFIEHLLQGRSLGEIDELMHESPLDPGVFSHWLQVGLVQSIRW